MILLSVIVPVYNVQDYIEDCLTSILHQINLDCTELIIVNDGSTDESLSIIKKFLNQKNVFLINQENKGLSAARNKGIENSKGRYLSFIDSDDIILDGFFLNIFSVLSNSSPDIIKFKFKTFRSFQCLNEHILYINKQGLVDVDYDLIVDLFNDSSWYAWAHIYKRDLFDKILFPVGLNFEDVATIPYLYVQCKSIYFLNKSLYGYRLRDGSITSSNDNNVICRNIKSLREVLNKLLNSSKNDIRFYILYIFFIRVYFSYLIRYRGLAESYQEWSILKIKSKVININADVLFRSKKHAIYYYLYKYFGFLSNFIMNYLIKLNDLYRRISS